VVDGSRLAWSHFAHVECRRGGARRAMGEVARSTAARAAHHRCDRAGPINRQLRQRIPGHGGTSPRPPEEGFRSSTQNSSTQCTILSRFMVSLSNPGTGELPADGPLGRCYDAKARICRFYANSCGRLLCGVGPLSRCRHGRHRGSRGKRGAGHGCGEERRSHRRAQVSGDASDGDGQMDGDPCGIEGCLCHLHYASCRGSRRFGRRGS